MERRLAAILAADIAGYSRLMGEDEEATVRALKEHHELILPLIGDNGGRVIDTAGDSVLAEFPSVLGAVSCGIAMQRTIEHRNVGVTPGRRILFRIGINQGEIILDGSRIYGDGINVAARLQAIAQPGGLCISARVHEDVVGRLEISWENLGAQKLKNIRNPVAAFRAKPETVANVVATPPRARTAERLGRLHWDRRLTLITLSLVLAIGGLATGARFWLAETPQSRRQSSSVTARSIAVMPFTNMSEDRNQGYFADGLSDDLINRLSRIADLFVIARSTMYSFKDRSVTAQEVAQKLGVRYVLEGSVRKLGDRLRINASLIDGESSRQIWAEQYDEDVGRVFSVQDDVVSQIIAALAVRLTSSEQTQLARIPTKNLEAYDYYLRAESDSYYDTDPSQVGRSLPLYSKATELDPDFADAYAGYARAAVQVLRYDVEQVLSSPVARKRAYEAAGEALRLDPNNGRAYTTLAILQLGDGRHEEAIRSARRAVGLNPNDAEAATNLGLILSYAGEMTEALTVTERALRLSPLPSPGLRELAGIVFYNIRQYDRAVPELSAASAAWPTSPAPHEYLAATYAHMGQLELARRELKTLPDYTYPKVSLAFARLWYTRYFKRAEDLNHHLDGLRAAGIPEWPLGFEGRPEDQVTGPALQSLTLDRTWTGYIPLGANNNRTPFFQQIDMERRVIFKSSHSLLSGHLRLEDDRVCVQFDGYLSSLWLCGNIYRNTAPDRNGMDYVHVLPEGLRYFSLKEKS